MRDRRLQTANFKLRHYLHPIALASAAKGIASAKKEVMAREAAALLDGTGWLPPVLRVPEATYPVDSDDAAIMQPVTIAAE